MASFAELLAEKQRRQSAQVAGPAPVLPEPQGSDPIAALRAEAERRRAAALGDTPPAQSVPEGATLVGTFADNGRVYRNADGSMGAVSAGGATNDPASVERIMGGEGFADVVQSSVDRQRIAENPVAARAQEVVRGVPFVGSYMDEAVGLVSPQARDNMRATSAAMQREKPGQTMGLNVGGVIAGSIPVAMAAAPAIAARVAPTLAGRVAQGIGAGIVTGGVEGAIYGSGEGRTDAERMAEATQGAAWGAGAGGVVGGVAGAVQGPIRAIMNRLKGADERVVATQLGVSAPAARVVRDALSQGGIDDAMEALRRAGDKGMLADAGLPARQLLDASAHAGGGAGQIARRAVDERTASETARMVGDLDRILGKPRGEREIIAGIRSDSAPARKQAYGAAYSAPIDYASEPGQRLEGLMGRVPASAIREAEAIMGADGVGSRQMIARVEVLPTGQERVTYETLPDVQTLHYIMQGLDGVVKRGDGKGALGGNTPLGRSYGNLRREISEALSEAVPEFRVAQDVAGDAIRSREAAELGYSLLRTTTRREDVAEGMAPRGGSATPPVANPDNLPALSPQDALREWQGLPKGERKAVREGIRSYIDDTTASIARTVTDPDTTTREGIRILRDMSSRASKAKLRMALGEGDAEALLASVDEAATAFELRAAIAENSKTALRQSIQGGVREQVSGGVLRTLMQGEPINATKRLTMALTGEGPAAQAVREAGIYEEIATALTTMRGPKAQEALETVKKAMDGQPLSDKEAKQIAATVGLTPMLASERSTRALPARQRLAP